MSQPDTQRSQLRFVEDFPQVIAARRLSRRAVAVRAGVDPSHLSKVLRGVGYKTPSADLVGRLATALDLPEDYWPEFREAKVIDRIRRDARLRELVYDSMLEPAPDTPPNIARESIRR